MAEQRAMSRTELEMALVGSIERSLRMLSIQRINKRAYPEHYLPLLKERALQEWLALQLQ